MIPTQAPTLRHKVSRSISPCAAARLSDGFTPSPHRRNSGLKRVDSATRAAFSLEDPKDMRNKDRIKKQRSGSLNRSVSSGGSRTPSMRNLTPESVADNDYNGRKMRNSQTVTSANSLRSETGRFLLRSRKRLLDLDGLWMLLKDFNVCPHLFG